MGIRVIRINICNVCVFIWSGAIVACGIIPMKFRFFIYPCITRTFNSVFANTKLCGFSGELNGKWLGKYLSIIYQTGDKY